VLGIPNAQKRTGIQSFFAPKSTGIGISNQAKRPRINVSPSRKKPSILNHFAPKK
jgi:hypothetical protein